MQLMFATGDYAQRHKERNAALDAQSAQITANDITAQIEKWHIARRHGLTGSQMAAVMEASKWSTPYSIWAFHMGRTQPDSNQTAAMEWGHRLEPVIAAKYSERFNVQLAELPTLQSAEYPFLVGSLDRVVLDDNGNPVKVLEIKTATMNHSSGEKDDSGIDIKEWGPGNAYSIDGRLIYQDSQVPVQYIIQVMHYMIITGIKQADIAVLMSGNDFRVYTIDYDPHLAASMIAAADRFWCEYVLDGIMPPLVEFDAKQLKPEPKSQIQATTDLIRAIEQYKLRNQELNQLKDEVQELRDQITGFIAENETLIDNHHHTLATYKLCKGRESFDAARLKLEMPDLYEQFIKKGTPFRRLLIK